MLSRPLNLAAPVVAAHPLNRGRIAWWIVLPTRLGGVAWRNLVDPTNPATLFNNPAWQLTTRPGGWGHLNFVHASTTQATPARVLSAGIFSLFAWVNLMSTVAQYNTVYTDDSTGLWLLASSGTYKIDYFSGADRTGATSLAVGRWHRVGHTYDGTTLAGYIDGVQDYSAAVAGVQLPTRPLLGIGGHNTTNNAEAFDGYIDDIAIWGRVLSVAEIRADYNLSRAGYPGVLARLRPTILVAPAAAPPAAAANPAALLMAM